MKKTIISYTIFSVLMIMLIAPVPPSSVVAIALLKNNHIRKHLVGWQLIVANLADETVKWGTRSIVYALIALSPQKKIAEVTRYESREVTPIIQMV